MNLGNEDMTMVTCHRRPIRSRRTIRNGPWPVPVTPQALTRTPQAFLSEAAGAIVLENGAVAFDLAQSKYSISGEYNRCLLHLWSAERNAVRRVLEAEVKNGTLRLAVQRMGQARPSRLEICRDRDRRSPSTCRAGRAACDQRLRRTLERHFPDFKIVRLTSGVDLEKSFGPIYPRGLIRQGRTAFAVLEMNAQETQSSIDAALTFGILWPDVCRKAPSANVVVEGLKQFVPAGTSSLTRERMANLNRAAAARDRFGALLGVALITFCAFLVGQGLALFVEFVMFRATGWAHFQRFNYGAVGAGYVVVAGIVSWFGMAIPLILLGDAGAWTALKRSWKLSNGYEGPLFFLVVESMAGSYVAWYAVPLGVRFLFPPHLQYTTWYGGSFISW
jgi:hypothetical protein